MLTRKKPAQRVVREQSNTEYDRELPQATLSDTVALTHLDEVRICFDLTSRVEDINPIAYLQNFTFSVQAGGHASITEHAFTPRETVTRQMSGANPRRELSHIESSCDSSDCSTVSHREVYATNYYPGTVQVSEGGGTICFPNRGYVTTETESIVLEQTPNSLAYTPQSFTWEFRADDS